MLMHHFGSGICSQIRCSTGIIFMATRPGDDHQVALARAEPHDLGAEPGDVESAGADGHQLDPAAGRRERHRPEAVLAAPVHDGVALGDDVFSGIS